MVDKQMGDFDVLDFVRLFRRMPEFPPITMEYADYLGTDYTRWIYRSEQEHMMSWFNGQTTKGIGAYSRNTPNRSAKRTYNRLLNATSVLWIAEVLGADQSLLRAAVRDSKKNLTTVAVQPSYGVMFRGKESLP